MRGLTYWAAALALALTVAVPEATELVAPSTSTADTQVANRTPSRKNGFVAPFPGSTKPDEILANIRAVIAQTALADVLELDDLKRDGIRIRRLLEVRSDNPSPGYFVAEIESATRSLLAVVAITKAGEMMAAQDIRGLEIPKALALAEVAERVTARRGRPPLRTEYVYFHNVAEPGVSYFRPLAVAVTERGPLYFNSRGEVFAEDGSPLVSELGPAGPLRATPPGMKRLRQLAKW
jgi:hypothetical protein